MNPLNDFTVKAVDSREVAKFIGKPHDQLIQDIAEYINILRESKNPEIKPDYFFLPSTYRNDEGGIRPRFLLTSKGFALVMNRLPDKMGDMFRIAYAAAFERMYKQLMKGTTDTQISDKQRGSENSDHYKQSG